MIEAWVAALAYTFQLYFDFSGYSDMAIGLARMFGIQLPLNFFPPYKSASIIDFWRRWHMTLSRFLRDYLYIPLGGNRKGRIRRYQNLMITMLLGGLWHGAGWNFIIWGGLHGLYLVINNAWRWVCNRLNIKPFDSFFGNITAIIITFLSVVIAWVFFRATSLNGAMSMISAMLGLNGISIESDMNQHVTNYIEYLGFKIVDIGLLPIINMDFIRVMTFIIPTMIIAFLFPNTAQFMRDTLRTPALKDFHALHLNKYNLPSLIWTSNFIMMVAITFMAILAFLSLTRVSEFLYFQF
jgi:alginate O-acetyltransferase complex protein AlgI